MSLFGLFGNDESAQRKQQILQWFMQEQQRQNAQIQAQNAEVLRSQMQAQQAPAAALAAAAPDPVVDNTPSGDPEGFLSSRLASLGLGGDDAGKVAALYRSSLAQNPKADQSSLFEQAFNTAQGDYRNTLTNNLRSTYGNDFSTRTFADTADDPIINAMLGRQRGAAQETIDRAKQRGQLNAAGYTAATGGLGDVETTGRADANQLGGAVLSRYRQNVDDALQSIYSGAGGASLGSNYDLEGAKTGIANKVNQLQGSLSGDISAAIGSKNYFDTGAILGKAGAQQGYVNPGAAPVADPTSVDDLRRRRTNVNQVF